MSRTYTAAVIGAGSGGKLSMRGLHESERFDLIAIADLSPDAQKAARNQYPNIQTFTHHADLFTQCPTDIVCVSTWPPSHLTVTRDALNLPPTGILVEKPLADTYADGCIVLDLIRQKTLPVAVPHGLLVAEHVHRIIHHVQNGDIGDLKLVEIQCANWDIINAGIHWLNFVAVLVDEPFNHVLTTCDKSTRTYRDGMQVETTAVTSIQTQSGIRIVMHTGDYLNVNHPDASTVFRLLGTEGDIEFYAWASRYRIRNANHPTGELIDIPQRPGTPHQRHLERLADQMDQGQPDYHIIESSLKALELCEAAYISARHGCTVTLPLTDFTPPQPNTWNPGIPYSGTDGGRDGRML